jgi:hypothetical protein
LVQSYESNSAPLNASRAVNMFAEQQVQDAKSKAPVAVYMHPGTAPFAQCGGGPIVNFTTMGGFVYAITTDSLYRIDDQGVATYLGRTSVSSNGCGVDNNGETICWCDGFSGWVYNASIGVQQITDVNWFPSYTCTYFDTYFVFVHKGTQQFYISPAQWNGTDALNGAMFASKEATSDLTVAIANSHQQLFICGEKRIEVWYDAGNAAPAFPFQRSYGALIQRGLMAPYTLVLEDNTLFFLGDDMVFYRLNGFVPERQSNHAIESKWQKYTGTFFARAFSYTVFGHKMIALTFPEAHATWVLDLSTKRWHERESWLQDNADSSIGRWRVNCVLNNSSSIENYPALLLGDSQSGRVDQLNLDVFTEFGSTMRAQIIGPPVHTDRRRVFMKRFEIDVETGVGLPFTAQLVNEFCPGAITMTTPSHISTAGALGGVPATFANFVFSNWVFLPDDGSTRGLTFGNNSLQIGIFNDQSSVAGGQITVRLWDAAASPILNAAYAFTIWGHWCWIGITCDTATNQLQVWINDGYTGDQQLTASSLTWSSTHPVANGTGHSWSLIPAMG